MNGKNGSGWRNRLRDRGLRRVALQLIAPVTLGLLVGGVLAYQAGSSNNMIHPVPLGAVATPTPSFGTSTAAPKTTAPGFLHPTARATAHATEPGHAKPAPAPGPGQ